MAEEFIKDEEVSVVIQYFQCFIVLFKTNKFARISIYQAKFRRKTKMSVLRTTVGKYMPTKA